MIEHFKSDEYSWLSNFAPCKIILDGIEYVSVEHAYMSAKSDNQEWKIFCKNEPKAGKVKRASSDITLIKDWNSIKISVMKECLEQKYSQSPYKEKLIDTGTEYIQEGNWHNDEFWGVNLNTNPPKGSNMLGKFIMEKRNALMIEHLI